MKLVQSKKKWVSDFNAAEGFVNDLEILMEFVKEGEVSDEEVTNQYQIALEAIENL